MKPDGNEIIQEIQLIMTVGEPVGLAYDSVCSFYTLRIAILSGGCWNKCFCSFPLFPLFLQVDVNGLW